MTKKILAAGLCALMASGCTTHFKKSYLSLVDEREETIGSVIFWDSDVNAAVIYEDGDICAQRAMSVITSVSYTHLTLPTIPLV